MPTTTEPPSIHPTNWCWWCGKPMWPWHHPYLVRSILGDLLTCSACQHNHANGWFATWNEPMLGWRDRRRMEEAAKRRKR
jgi:hypothetical protein